MLKKSGVLLFDNDSFITDVSRFDYYGNNDSLFEISYENEKKCRGYHTIIGKRDFVCPNELSGYIACNSEPIAYFCDVHKTYIMTMIKCECGNDEIYGYVDQNKLYGVCIRHYRNAKYFNSVIRAEYTICHF